MADTHEDRKPSERREPKKPTPLAQGDDDYFSRPHNEATHGEDPAVAQQLGDV